MGWRKDKRADKESMAAANEKLSAKKPDRQRIVATNQRMQVPSLSLINTHTVAVVYESVAVVVDAVVAVGFSGVHPLVHLKVWVALVDATVHHLQIMQARETA